VFSEPTAPAEQAVEYFKYSTQNHKLVLAVWLIVKGFNPSAINAAGVTEK